MLQQFIVYAIVLVAAVYAAWRLMPAAWRTQLASRLAGGAQRSGLVDAHKAEQLRQQLSTTPGCGSCSSCKGCGHAPHDTAP